MKKVDKKTNTIVGLKELRNNIESYIRRVKKGETFTVVRRSDPVFTIVAPGEDEQGWETVVDFTEINKEGISAEQVLKALNKLA